MMAVLFWLCAALILYTYFGYPLLLALLARLRPAPRPAAEHLPQITLLIAAYNEADVIEQKLRNSLSLDYPAERLQVLVAADGSTDRTVEICRAFSGQGVEVLHRPGRQGKMAAIIHAMQHVRGEVVVFSDANNFYLPGALRALAAPFADPQVGAVTGAKKIARGGGALGESEGLYWKYESFIKKQESRLSSCTSAPGEILALRRSLFSAPPENVINDDFFIAMQAVRQGYRLVYAPQAVSVEQVSLSAKDEMVRRTRIVAGRYQIISLSARWMPWKNPLVVWQVVSHKFLRPLVPFAMLGALLFNLLALIFPSAGTGSPFWNLAAPWGTIFLALQVVFYALAWIGGRVHSKLLYLPAFLVNSNLAALAGLAGYLRKEQSVLWERVRRRDHQEPELSEKKGSHHA